MICCAATASNIYIYIYIYIYSSLQKYGCLDLPRANPPNRTNNAAGAAKL